MSSHECVIPPSDLAQWVHYDVAICVNIDYILHIFLRDVFEFVASIIH